MHYLFILFDVLKMYRIHLEQVKAKAKLYLLLCDRINIIIH